MVLYIVRHGQTEENNHRILQGHMPGTLTEEGKEQIRRSAELLAEKGIKFKCIVSSDLKRALDSAQIMAKRLHLPVIPMKILRERDWGEYTGMSQKEAANKYKINGKWNFPGESVETEEMIYCRAQQALMELYGIYEKDTIILVTHGQFARNLIAAQNNCSYHDIAPFVNAEIRTLVVTK